MTTQRQSQSQPENESTSERVAREQGEAHRERVNTGRDADDLGDDLDEKRQTKNKK